MPLYPTKPPFDPAAAASNLPSGLQWLGGAAGSMAKDLVGGDDPNSQLMSPSPMMAGGTELGPLAKTLVGRAVKKISSIEHPAMQELLWMLGNAKPAGDEAALATALSQRVTPSIIKPSTDPVKLPYGFHVPGYIPYRNGAPQGTLWYPPNARIAKPPVLSNKITPRQGTGAFSRGVMANLTKKGLTEESVRSIRKTGSLEKALELFPDVKPGTIKGILSGDTFGWVK